MGVRNIFCPEHEKAKFPLKMQLFGDNLMNAGDIMPKIDTTDKIMVEVMALVLISV